MGDFSKFNTPIGSAISQGICASMCQESTSAERPMGVGIALK